MIRGWEVAGWGTGREGGSMQPKQAILMQTGTEMNGQEYSSLKRQGHTRRDVFAAMQPEVDQQLAAVSEGGGCLLDGLVQGKLPALLCHLQALDLLPGLRQHGLQCAEDLRRSKDNAEVSTRAQGKLSEQRCDERAA